MAKGISLNKNERVKEGTRNIHKKKRNVMCEIDFFNPQEFSLMIEEKIF